jgi:signal peptidase
MNLERCLTFASRLVDALLVVLVATVIACVALTALGPRYEHPSLVIRGGSMEPAIPLGSLVILEPVGPVNLRVGDVVSFQATNGTIVTHRVTRLASLGQTPYFGTKGDANADPDPVITPDSAIIGRVTLTLPGAGYLMTLIHAPVGFLAVLLIALTLLVVALLLDELAYDRRRTVRAHGPAGTLTISGQRNGGDP